MNGFSFGRFVAIMVKEFVQMRRDRLTFAMIIGIPIMQLILFGFAINSDPKALPAVVRSADNSAFARAFVVSLKNSGYFAIQGEAASEAEAERLIERGEVQFVINIPADFSRALMQGRRPQILIEADATDPAATSNAIAALTNAARTAFDRELVGALARLKPGADPIDLVIHRRYNPEGITQYNVVPGLMGVVLTMTMVVMTAMAMTRERERGTIEALLATPARPGEVMLGKIVPYIAVGYIQVVLILVAAWALFAVPLIGSLWLLLLYAVVYWFYMVNRVGREEARLRQALGAPYAEYCGAVRRFLPGPPYRDNPVLYWSWSLLRQNHGWTNLAGTLAFWVAVFVWIRFAGA